MEFDAEGGAKNLERVREAKSIIRLQCMKRDLFDEENKGKERKKSPANKLRSCFRQQGWAVLACHILFALQPSADSLCLNCHH